MPLIDSREKNRFTFELSAAPSGSEYLYFMLSAGDTYGDDVYGDIEVTSFATFDGVASAVGVRIDSGSFYLSADGGVYENDFGNVSGTFEGGVCSALNMYLDGYGMYGILGLQYQNADGSNDMNIFTKIEFRNIVEGSFLIHVTNPPPLP